MNSTLRILLLAFSVLFLISVVRLIARGRVQLKYSLLWLLLGFVLLICALLPKLVVVCAHRVGIETPVNFVFLMGLIMLMGICVSLTIIVSWQAHDIRSLIQRIALLEKQVYENEDKETLPSE